MGLLPGAPTEATQHRKQYFVRRARIPDRDFRIGPSYLMKDWVYQEPGGLEEVWDTELLPLLEEHHAGEDLDVEQRYGLPALRAEADAANAAEQAGEE